MKYALLIVCLYLPFLSATQINYTANDQVQVYTGQFRPGINFGSYPTYSDEELAELAAGNPTKEIPGVGVKAARPGLFEAFTELYGIDARVNTYQYYEQLGMKENTVIVGFPSLEHTDQTYYCPTIHSTLFKNMYLDIWDDANGTAINDSNYYAKYIYDLVTTYKDYVRFWEIWNEPGFDYSGALGPLPPGAPDNWWDNNPDPCDYKLRAPIMHYVRMLRISYEVIKTVDPTAYVTVSGTGYPSFLDAILRNTDNPVDGSPTPEYPLGGGAYFDVMGYHAYPHFDGSLRTWVDSTQSWSYHRHSDAASDGLGASKDSMQVVLNNHGYDGNTYPKKNWIITESNLPRKAFGDFIGSNDAQKNFIIKSYIHCIRDTIAQMHYYKISEDTDYDGAYYEFHLMGLYKKLNNQAPIFQNPTDEGIALATTTQLLFGKTLDEARLAQLNLPQGVRGAAFKDENENYTYVLWAATTIDQSEVAFANYSFPSGLGFVELNTYNWDYSKSNQFETTALTDIPLTATPKFFSEQIFETNTQSFCASVPVLFEANSIAGATSYAWTFDGGNPTTSSLQNPTSTFAQAGKHAISCKIYNASGNIIKQQTIDLIVESPPTPYFDLSIKGPILRIDSLTGWTNAQTIQWDFGDGNTSTSASPTHLYLHSGDYTVALTATNNCGSNTYTKVIHIDAPTNNSLPYTANDTVLHQDGQFRPGANLKTSPNWTDSQIADIAAGNLSKNIKGAGVKSFRTILGENFLDFWGYDIRLDAFKHYENLDIIDNTITLGTPTYASLDSFAYCPNKQAAIFDNLYEDIWDDGTDGTPINDENYFASYVYHTVITYRDYVKYWEIFNSPDFDESGKKGWLPPGQLGNWWDSNPEPCDVALGAPIFYYNRMLRVAYEIIKKYDPDSYVTIPGLAFPSFLDAVLRNTDNPIDGSVSTGYERKGGAYFDAIGIKSFPHFDGSTSHYDGNIGGLAYDRHSDAAVSGIARVKGEFEDVFASHGYDGITYPTKEWIVSEANLPRIQFDEFIGSDAAQRNWIIKAYISCIKNDIRQLGIFSIAERSANPADAMDAMGLYNNLDATVPYQMSLTNEGSAYKTASDILYGTTYSDSLTSVLNLPNTLDGGAFFDGAGKPIYVLWAKTKDDLQEFVLEDYDFPTSLFPGTFYALPWHFSYTGIHDTITEPTLHLTGSPIFLVEDLDLLQSPIAYFSASTTEGCIGVPIQFTNESTENTTNFTWNFPQGTPSTSTQENPNVVFAQAGTYAISLTVSNPAGSHKYTDSITILPNPIAHFEYQVTGNQVAFTNLSENATTYDWDFGDNTGTYHPVHPNYHYNTNGVFPVQLIAKNNCGADTLTLNIEISAPPITAHIPLVQSCDTPFVIHFIDNSFNNPSSWFWEFEGGIPATSTEESPYVSYSLPGTYQVIHIAINEFGADTLVEEIIINGQQNEFLSPTVCSGDSLVISGFVFDEDHPTGEIQLINPNGCDTLLHVELHFMESQDTFLVDSIQVGESYTVGSSVYTTEGTYTDTLTTSIGCDSIVHLELTIIQPNSTKELESIQKISYYPNPVSDWIHFSFLLAQKATVRIEIYDMSGKQIVSLPKKILPTGIHELSYDMGSFSSGVYFAKVITDSQVRTLRFIKSNQ